MEGPRLAHSLSPCMERDAGTPQAGQPRQIAASTLPRGTLSRLSPQRPAHSTGERLGFPVSLYLKAQSLGNGKELGAFPAEAL